MEKFLSKLKDYSGIHWTFWLLMFFGILVVIFIEKIGYKFLPSIDLTLKDKAYLSVYWVTAIVIWQYTRETYLLRKISNVQLEKSMEERLMGLSLRTVDLVGNGIIENNSKVDYWVELSKSVLCTGGIYDQSALDIQRELLDIGTSRDQKKLRQLARATTYITLLPKQVLSVGESTGFHIHSMRAEDIRLIFILLRLSKNNEVKYYLYRFAHRGLAGHNPSELQDSVQPYNEWVRVYSFDK